MKTVKWNPRKDISRLAWYNTVKHMPNWTVDTVNKYGKERTVTVVQTAKNRYNLIIDGVSHRCNAFNIERTANLLLGELQGKKIICVLLNNPAFD